MHKSLNRCHARALFAMRSGSVEPFLPDRQERFRHRGYSNVWATVLFTLCFVAFIVLVGFALASLTTNSAGSFNPAEVAILWAIAVGVAAVVSLLYIILLFSFPRQMIAATMITTSLIGIGLGIYLIVISAYVAGALALLLALIVAWMYISMRTKIVH